MGRVTACLGTHPATMSVSWLHQFGCTIIQCNCWQLSVEPLCLLSHGSWPLHVASAAGGMCLTFSAMQANTCQAITRTKIIAVCIHSSLTYRTLRTLDMYAMFCCIPYVMSCVPHSNVMPSCAISCAVYNQTPVYIPMHCHSPATGMHLLRSELGSSPARSPRLIGE